MYDRRYIVIFLKYIYACDMRYMYDRRYVGI